jgi:dolichol-phosphate mannosyltransferase
MMPKRMKQFLRFGLVGGVGVLVDMSVLFLLVDPRLGGWNLSPAKAVAAEAAIINNFIWNDVWTFRGVSAGPAGRRGQKMVLFCKFNLICLVGMGMNILLLNLQVRCWHLNVYLANLIAIGLVSIWNFWMNVKFGWTTPKN